MYKARKKSKGDNAQRGEDGKYLKDQNDPSGDKPKTTAEAIARELGIAEPTVKRAEKFHDGIDAIREMSKEAADKAFPFTDNPFFESGAILKSLWTGAAGNGPYLTISDNILSPSGDAS